MVYKFGKRSKDNLRGLHPDLLKVMNAAIVDSPLDFAITDGLRTLAQQKQYVAEGKSKTMKSRHLSGKAVDTVVFDKNGKGSWSVELYKTLAKHVLKTAKKLGVAVTWGGSWSSFPDYVHFELDKKKYGY